MKTAIKRLVGAACALGLLAGLSNGVARADCPLSGIWYGCNDLLGQYTADPSRTYYGGAWTAGSPCPYGCYDLPHGTLHAEGVGNPYSPGCGSHVVANDAFTLLNAAPGTSVPCQAILRISGSLTGAGTIGAGLEDSAHPGTGVNYFLNTAQPNVSVDLVLPLSLSSDNPVTLNFFLAAFGDFPAGTSQATAVLRFSGLPAGVTVVSCQSYDLPVPAQPATWGRLKAVYR
jgi:hypothetical protein